MNGRTVVAAPTAAADKSSLFHTDYGVSLILLICIAMIGGQFSFSRLSGSEDSLSTDIRLVLLPLVLVAAAMRFSTVRSPPAMSARKIVRWMGWLALFHFYVSLTALWSPAGTMARWEALLLFFGVLLVAVCMRLVAENPEKTIRFLSLLFLFAALIYAIAGFIGIGTQDSQGRLSAFLGGPNVFVRLMVTGSVGAIYLAMRRKRYAWLAIVPVLLVAALLTGSRGGLLALGLLLVASLPRMRRFGTRLLVPLMIVLGSGMFLLTFGFIRGEQVDFVEERFVQQTIEDRYTSNRDAIYLASIGHFIDNVIVGGGFRSFEAEIGAPRLWAYPHNIILETGSEGGLVGLALLFPLLIPLATRTRSRSLEFATLLFLARYYFLAAMFSGSYYDNRFIWFFLGLSLVVQVSERPKQFRSENESP